MPTTWTKREQIAKPVGYDTDFAYDDDVAWDDEYFGTEWTERNPI